MNIIEVFKEGADISGKNFIIFVPMVFVMVIIFILSFEFMPFGFMGGGMYPVGMATSPFGFLSGWFVIIMFVSIILGFFAYGATVGMAKDIIEKGSSNLNSGINIAVNRFVPLLAGAILLGIIEGVGFMLLVIPGLIAVFFLMFTPVAIIIDNMDAVSAMKKSIGTVKLHLNDALVFFVALIAVSVVFMVARMIIGFIPFIGQLIGFVLMGVLWGYIAVVTVKVYMRLNASVADNTASKD
ncbi:MAG: hypothetical protein ACYDDB_00360 [bacterium]